MEELIALLKFAIANEDKFTEWDPDLVKHQWIEAAKKAVAAAQQSDKADKSPLCSECGGNLRSTCIHVGTEEEKDVCRVCGSTNLRCDVDEHNIAYSQCLNCGTRS